MFHDLFPHTFSEDELYALNSREGKRLTRVDYIIWQNLTTKGDGYQALDWVELTFEDGDKMALTAGEESDGLKLRELNFGLEQTRVQQQFNGQVKLERENVSTGSVWKRTIGNRLTSVGLLEGPDERIQNNQLQLDFEGVRIRFELNEEGMIVRPEQ